MPFKDKEKQYSAQRKWALANPEKVREIMRRYDARNREKRRLAAQTRRLNPEVCERERQRSREYRQENIERLREKGRAYNQEPKRKAALEQWRHDHADVMYQFTLNFIKNNPEKHAAHAAVRNALRRGTLQKQACETCGNIKSEAHHEDYSKPLEVIWLCRKHHAAADRARRIREANKFEPSGSKIEPQNSKLEK